MNTNLTNILDKQNEQLHQMSKNLVLNFLQQYEATILKQLEFAVYLSESNDEKYKELYNHIVAEGLYSDYADFEFYIKGIDDITCATKDQIFESVSRHWLVRETSGKIWVGYRTALGLILNTNMHYGTLSFDDIKWILHECINERTDSYDPNGLPLEAAMYYAYDQLRHFQHIEKDIKQLIKTYGKFNNHAVSTEEIAFDYFEKKKND